LAKDAVSEVKVKQLGEFPAAQAKPELLSRGGRFAEAAQASRAIH
jgi:hypothetical protein